MRVEPDSGVQLIAPLKFSGEGPGDRQARKAQMRAGRRTRLARIGEGDALFLVGALHPGPGAAALPILRPPPQGRMIVSTEPPEELHKAKARLHRNWAYGWGCLLILSQVALFGGFHLVRWRGQIVEAQVERTKHFEEWGPQVEGVGRSRRLDYEHKELKKDYYFVDANYTDSARGKVSVSDHISKEFYLELAGSPGPFLGHEEARRKIPFLIVPGWPSLGQVGTEGTIGRWQPWALSCGILTSLLLYGATILRNLRWGERRRLVEGALSSLLWCDP